MGVRFPCEFNLNNSYRSGTIKDVTSARVSIPPQLALKEDPAKGHKEYVWKIDLMASQQYWLGKIFPLK